MYEVDRTDYGIYIELEGMIDDEELQSFYADLEQQVQQFPGKFNIYADHRGVKTMPEGIDEKFADLMAMCKEGGLDKSVVITDSSLTAMQQRRLRDEIGMDGQKVVNAGDNPDWESEAHEWVET